jgi:hypothetical protein
VPTARHRTCTAGPSRARSRVLPPQSPSLTQPQPPAARRSFRPLGSAADLSHLLSLPPYAPRPALRIADLGAALPPGPRRRLAPGPGGPHPVELAASDLASCLFEFDFTGVLVRGGELHEAAGGVPPVLRQWLFLADATSGLISAAGLEPGAGGAGGGEGGGGAPWMLAVELLGGRVWTTRAAEGRGGGAARGRLQARSEQHCQHASTRRSPREGLLGGSCTRQA